MKKVTVITGEMISDKSFFAINFARNFAASNYIDYLLINIKSLSSFVEKTNKHECIIIDGVSNISEVEKCIYLAWKNNEDGRNPDVIIICNESVAISDIKKMGSSFSRRITNLLQMINTRDFRVNF